MGPSGELSLHDLAVFWGSSQVMNASRGQSLDYGDEILLYKSVRLNGKLRLHAHEFWLGRCGSC